MKNTKAISSSALNTTQLRLRLISTVISYRWLLSDEDYILAMGRVSSAYPKDDGIDDITFLFGSNPETLEAIRKDRLKIRAIIAMEMGAMPQSVYGDIRQLIASGQYDHAESYLKFFEQQSYVEPKADNEL